MKHWKTDELNRFHFVHEEDRLRANLLVSASWLKNSMNHLLKTFDITLTQYNALQILKHHKPKPLSTLHLREEMLEKMSDTPKIVDRLLKKGLVNKTTSSHDRRLVDITITEAGLELLKRIDQHHEGMHEITGSLSENEVHQLNQLLSKLRLAPKRQNTKRLV